MAEHILPDLLAPGLRIVVCGSAAGQKSADLGHYYAGPGNKFWETLHTIGLTPRQLAPEEWSSLLEYRIGLTDIVKDQSGPDSGIKFQGGKDLRRKIREFAPGMLVFNGKQAAKEYLDMPTVVYGPQKHMIGTAKIFVCPSTSAAAKGSWDPRWWDLMSKLA